MVAPNIFPAAPRPIHRHATRVVTTPSHDRFPDARPA